MSEKKFSEAKHFLSVGEIMLRLTPPDHGVLKSAAQFEVRYGGSEANVAVSLAGLGIDSSYFTVVPDHAIGRGAAAYLMGAGVRCDRMIFSGPEETPTFRLGTYYLEKGFGIRPSQVVYDRKHSAVTEYDHTKIDFDVLLEGIDWVHLSGITPALGDNCRELLMDCLKAAKEKGLLVSFDGNSRSSLWSWEEARDFCTGVLPYVDVLFGIEPFHLWKDAEDPQAGDVKDGLSPHPGRAEQQAVLEAFAEKYPNLKCIARHVRAVKSGSVNSLKAYIWLEGETVESRELTFEVLDRVGAGDAFAAGLIYALMKDFPPQRAADFAVAAAALKHTINGDANVIGDPQTILGVLGESIDIQR